jgi:hypothetical protein
VRIINTISNLAKCLVYRKHLINGSYNFCGQKSLDMASGKLTLSLKDEQSCALIVTKAGNG